MKESLRSRFQLLFIMLVLLSTTIYSQNDLPVMLKVKANFDLSENAIETFRSGAEDTLTAQKFLLISKEQQDEALSEQAKQKKSDCYDDACLVDTGKMMSAKMIFIINVRKMGAEYIFKARLVDLETGSTKKTVTKVYKEKLESASKLLEFSKKLTALALPPEVKLSSSKVKDIVYISIKTSPEKANIFVNEKFVGTSPMKIKVSNGKHKIKIKLKEYKDVVFEDNFYYDLKKDIKLVKEYVYLDIRTNPSFADIFLNGKKIGKSPIKHKITSGKYTIKVSKNNFSAIVITKNLSDNFTKFFTLEDLCKKENLEHCFIKGRKLVAVGALKSKSKVLGNSLLKKACLLGHEKSCINISNSDFIYKLGKRFQKGIGVKKNIALSNKLLARGCELGSQYSCYSLALSLNDENPKGANKYYRRGCILNHAASCYFIAHDYEVNKSNNESAKKFYKKACSLGDKISCNHKIGAKGAGVCNFSETNQANNTLFFIFIVLFTFTLRKKILKAK